MSTGASGSPASSLTMIVGWVCCAAAMISVVISPLAVRVGIGALP
jgi:hypothetical protein